MGWFGRKSREKVRDDLLRKMGQGKVCAEIGVFRGDFSERILLISRPSRLHLIDPWKYEPDPSYEKAVYGSGAAKGQPAMDGIFNSVRERFEQDVFDAFYVFLETDLYLVFQAAVFKGGIHGDRISKQVSVRNDDPATIIRFDGGSAHGDIFDGAFELLDHNLVADLERRSYQEQNACQEILEEVMKGKANGHTSDP